MAADFGLQVMSPDGRILAENTVEQYLIDRSPKFTIKSWSDGTSGRTYFPQGNSKPVYLGITGISNWNPVVIHKNREITIPLVYPYVRNPVAGEDRDYVYWQFPYHGRDSSGLSRDDLTFTNITLSRWAVVTYTAHLFVTLV